MALNFLVIHVAPGGPIDQILSNIKGSGVDVTARVSGIDSGELQQGGQQPLSGEGPVGQAIAARRASNLNLSPSWSGNMASTSRCWSASAPCSGTMRACDFGESYFRDETVIDLILEKMPVSISLGLWTTFLTYLIAIPLGIRKAVNDGSTFDVWTSAVVIIGNAVPSFLFAILLIVLFAGGSFFDWFPLRGLTSDNWDQLSFWGKIVDYFWHLALPLTALMIGAFAGLTMLTKNSFLDQINMQYVQTARAKGLTESRVLYGHVFRNAMLIVIAGFPGAFIGILFTGSLLIEIIFSLDGLGLLGYEAALKRDYPVMFASLYMFGLLGLVVQLITDLTYVLIDPRIDFETREA